uniref:Ribosomal protein S3 n=1 Tax=Amorphochlora amoebiformis TaxID=1561963 RepID=A0A0H5BR18_9EUKA|nr:ribosomal protein S3 [Amorphochlora amoebiformis]
MLKKYSYRSKNCTFRGINQGLIQILMKKGLRYCRFLKYYFIKRKNKTYFIIYLKPCKKKKKNNSKTTPRLFNSITVINKIQKASYKRIKKIALLLKKRSKFCNFHSYWIRKRKIHLKTHCFSNSLIRLKLFLLKSLLSRTLNTRLSSIRLVQKDYFKTKTNSFLQGVRMREQLIYTDFSFKKIVDKCLKYTLSNGARGCLVQIKGIHKSTRTKTLKFKKGIIKHSGGYNARWQDSYSFNLIKKKGVLGIKIKIMQSNKYLNLNTNKYYLPGRISKLKKLYIFKKFK